jgi:hypothetical protein
MSGPLIFYGNGRLVREERHARTFRVRERSAREGRKDPLERTTERERPTSEGD